MIRCLASAWQYVATVSESPAAFEGHPFIVEAGVSIGGQAVKDGINVYRFANRIPLLFEVRITPSYHRERSTTPSLTVKWCMRPRREATTW